MKKLIKLLCMTLLLTTVFSITKEADAKAARSKEWKITRVDEIVSNAWRNGFESVGESGEAGWYHVADRNDKFKPTCKKNKDGSYTLTLYDGTWLYLDTNLRWGKDVNKWVLKADKDVSLSYNASDIRVYVNANKIRGKAGKTVTKTTYVQPTVVNDNGKTVKKGKKIKIKVVIKHDPKVISELKKIVKNEIKYDKKTFSDFDKAFAAYTWVYKNIKYGGSTDITLSETIKKKESNARKLFILMCDLMDLPVEYYYNKYNEMEDMFVKVDGKWYEGYPEYIYEQNKIKNSVYYGDLLKPADSVSCKKFKKYKGRNLKGSLSDKQHSIAARLYAEYERLEQTLLLKNHPEPDNYYHWSEYTKQVHYELDEDESSYTKEYWWDKKWYSSLPEYKTEWTGKEYVPGKGENCF